MEDVVRQIIKIEDDARQAMEETLQKKETSEKEHETRLKDLRKKIINDAHNKVSQIREREFVEIEEKKKDMRKECEEQMTQIQKNADQHMDEWVNELVNRVLKEKSGVEE